VPTRWKALDEFRGISMLLLVLGNPLLLFPSMPAWLNHAPGNGLYVADLIVPAFLFAIGLSYAISLDRRTETHGLMKTTVSFARRYGLLLCFGLLGEAAMYRDFTFSHWGMLEAIGLCGIALFPLMFVGPLVRLIIGGACLLLWQAAVDGGYAATALSFDLGGPLATLAWSFIVLVGSALSHGRLRMSHRDFVVLLAGTVVVAGAAAWSAGLVIPVNKHLVTIPYVMAGIAVSSGALLTFELLADYGIVSAVFEMFGKNALLIYIVSGFETLAIMQLVPQTLPVGSVLLLALSAYVLCHVIAGVLDKKRIYVKI